MTTTFPASEPWPAGPVVAGCVVGGVVVLVWAAVAGVVGAVVVAGGASGVDVAGAMGVRVFVAVTVVAAP